MKLVGLSGKTLEKAISESLINRSDNMIERLNTRLKEGLNHKKISGEQWFRQPEIWYSITSYSNPYFTVHSELNLVTQNREKLAECVNNKTLVFYGVGTGDTESEFVKLNLEKEKYVEVVAIDAIYEFLERYCSCLINLLDSDTKHNVSYLGINNLFESINRRDLELENSKHKSLAHICLGTTIGNFDIKEIFNKFAEMSKAEDTLAVGFHLDHNLEKINNRYENSYRFKELITNFMDKPDLSKVKIIVNEKERQIEAWYNDLMVFHSKKLSQKKVGEVAEEFGFKPLFECNDQNSCIMAFKYDP